MRKPPCRKRGGSVAEEIMAGNCVHPAQLEVTPQRGLRDPNQSQQKNEVQWIQPPDAIAGCPPGLEYLTQVNQLLVHQQVELLEIITGYETPNRYRIKNNSTENVYLAVEESHYISRQCCGSRRPFTMSLQDQHRRKIIYIKRSFGCSTCWCCFCCLQHMEVQSPPGTVIGYIDQDCTFIYPCFSLKNADGETVMKIKGPLFTCKCFYDVEFSILFATDLHMPPVGKVTKEWSGLAQEYFTDADNFKIEFPMDLDVKMKAVVLAATFLIDFMFFETQSH